MYHSTYPLLHLTDPETQSFSVSPSIESFSPPVNESPTVLRILDERVLLDQVHVTNKLVGR